MTLRFANASPASRMEGIGVSSPATYVRAGFGGSFPQYPKLALRHVYPGIDVVFYGNGEHLEYDLVVSPRGDLERVRLVFEGAREVRVDADGNLKIEAGSSFFVQRKPRVFQSDGRSVSAGYILLPNHQVGFRVGRHDPKLALTIDPELVFNKYFGGSGTDTASAIATDAQGNVYIAGASNSVDFPVTNGSRPKLTAPLIAISNGAITPVPVSTESSVQAVAGTSDGSVLYAFCADAVYVSSDGGATWTQRLPLPVATTITHISVDPIDPARIFVATNSGLYSSDEGGEYWGLVDSGLPSNGNGTVTAIWVAVSPLDHETTYVGTGAPFGLYKTTNAGVTWTTLNPTYAGQPTGAGFQSSVPTLSPDGNSLYLIDQFGNLLRSTDGGATWQELAQQLYGAASIVLDPTNPSNIYVTDYSGIQKSSDGGMTFATLLARSASAQVPSQIALDASSGTLYFGNSQGLLYALPVNGGSATSLPVAAPNLHWLTTLSGNVYAAFNIPQTPYVIKWDPSGTTILYSTFFGGTVYDAVAAMAVDAQGECTVAGITSSPDFPVTSNFNSGGAVGPQSGFVTRISADGTRLIYSALLGQSVLLQAIALDSAGAAYITGQTQATGSFPLSSNAFQSTRPQPICSRPSDSPFLNADSLTDAFVSKISADGSQLVYSSLLTGSCGGGGDGIAVDAAGEAVVVGSTTSADFPATAGSYQAAFPGNPAQTSPPNALSVGFAAKISVAGDRVIAATYLGGSFQSEATAVAVDSSGNIYLTGGTANILPGATPGAYQPTVVDRCAYPVSIGPSPPYGGTDDAFVLKLDPLLSTAAYLTYLGGGCNDNGSVIALDPAGNAWIGGFTQSSDFPLKSPFVGGGISSRFVSEISPDGSQLVFSSATDGVSLAIDPAGQVYLAGSAAEWSKINPSQAPPLVIDNVQAVTAYPPSILEPSYLGNSIVPGELIQIAGRNFGPTTQVNGQFDATGRLPFTLANIIVLFDNVPAPLVSVSGTTISCFAPFEIAQVTNITVESNGTRSNSVR